MLKIEHLTKVYGGSKLAVDDLSLTVGDGDIFAFIGENGAGKTTTIKCVVGILSFDQGKIEIDGHSIKTEPVECKRVLAYIPDNPDLYETMKGIDFLNFVCDVFEVPAGVRDERIRKYADALELTPNLGNLISSYSHGMKQKLAVISALIHEPRLLILDEPFVGLDPRAAFILKGFMRELADKGAAIFFSTHVLEVAEKLCDKVAIIKDGRLVASGSMDEVKGNSSLEHVFLELTDD